MGPETELPAGPGEPELRVRHLADVGRFEAEAEGRVACVLDYRREGNSVAILHTRTMSGFERRGIATRLVEHVLRDAAALELSVLPYCWFVGDVMRREPEFADLVPSDQRQSFGL